MSLRSLTARVDAHSATRLALTDRAEWHVRRVLTRFDGWYDHDAISRMTRDVVRYVEAAQRGVATATDAYLAQVATEVAATTIGPVGIIDPADLRAGVTHAGAYGRLADEYRFRIFKGERPDDVLAAILQRAAAMVGTDMTLAFTHQSRRFMTTNGVAGYRRVIRPEMSKTGTCGLCLVASDQIYSRGDLLPIHGGTCHCTVLPIRGGIDPGRSLNRDELDRLYDDAGSTRAEDLLRTRYRIEEHGEIGPVLVDAGHAFRGPGDL